MGFLFVCLFFLFVCFYAIGKDISQGTRGKEEAAPEYISDIDSQVNKMQIWTVIAAMFRKENKNQNKT